MAYTLGIDLDIDQVKLCLIHVEGPQRVPYVDWLIFRVPFSFGPDYYCEFGSALMETIAHFLFIKKLGPQQINRIYFVCGMPYSAFASFEEGLHYTANIFIQSLFDPDRVGIIRADGKPVPPRELLQIKGEGATAFVATQFFGSAYIASRLHKNALVADIGSGMSHITPVLKSRIAPQSRAKVSKYLRTRMLQKQLLFKGNLFTSVNQISSGIPTKEGVLNFTPRVCRMVVIASLLKYVHPEIAREHDFPLLEERDARILIARAVGLDVKSLSDKEIDVIAHKIYSQLSSQVGEAFESILERQGRMAEKMQLITSGIGGKHLMNTCFSKSPIGERLIHLEDKLPHRLHEAASAYGVALNAMDRLMDTSFPPDRVEVMP